jgi:carbon storage regulator CsrA
MLVLTRKRDEQIQIGNNVTITVVRLAGGTVRIGIDAPPEVWIRRGELLQGDPIASRAPTHSTRSDDRPHKSHDARMSGPGKASILSPHRGGQTRSGTQKPR